MPWMETEPMTERMEFVMRVRSGLYTMEEACRRPAVLVANRAPQRTVSTTASPDSRQSQRILALRRPRHEIR